MHRRAEYGDPWRPPFAAELTRQANPSELQPLTGDPHPPQLNSAILTATYREVERAPNT